VVYKDCIAQRDQLQESSTANDQVQIDLSPLRELARRFNLSFGLDMAKQREALAALHRECIRFALTPLTDPNDPTMPGPNILFLDVLPEFASKLFRPDKKAIYEHMEKLIHNVAVEGEAWEKLINYRRILLEEGGSHARESKARTSTAGRGRKRTHHDVTTTIDDNSRM